MTLSTVLLRRLAMARSLRVVRTAPAAATATATVRVNQRHPFSLLGDRWQSTASLPPKVASSPSIPPPVAPVARRLPAKHSRNKFPAVCTDPVALQELTASILQAAPGTLFRYEPNAATTATGGGSSNSDSSAAAWEAAHAVTQKVEYLIRGHAHSLPGTVWNRWLKSPTTADSDSSSTTTSTTSTEAVDVNANVNANVNVNVDNVLQTMQALVDRLHAEGQTYMTLRADRMQEVHGPKRETVVATTVKITSANDPSMSANSLESFLRGNESEDEDDDDEEEVDTTEYQTTEVFSDVEALGKDIEHFAAQEGNTGADEEDMFVVERDQNYTGGRAIAQDAAAFAQQRQHTRASYMHDFAAPGVSVAMYDTLLDAMACHATSNLVHPTSAFTLLQEVVGRHELDGGNDSNTLRHTLPTAISFNAVIRIAAELPFDIDSTEPADIRTRDDALTVAFGAFDALYRSTVERNCATYSYLLRAVAKYFPPSRIRGNVAHGMFHHAAEQGLIDATVVEAHKTANTPSNGPEFDEWMASTLTDKAVGDLPHEWRRCSRVRWHHPREAVY